MDETRPPLRRDDPRYWGWSIVMMLAAALALFVWNGLVRLAVVHPAAWDPVLVGIAGMLSLGGAAAMLLRGWPRAGHEVDGRKPMAVFGGVFLLTLGFSLMMLAVR